MWSEWRRAAPEVLGGDPRQGDAGVLVQAGAAEAARGHLPLELPVAELRARLHVERPVPGARRGPRSCLTTPSPHHATASGGADQASPRTKFADARTQVIPGSPSGENCRLKLKEVIVVLDRVSVQLCIQDDYCRTSARHQAPKGCTPLAASLPAAVIHKQTSAIAVISISSSVLIISLDSLSSAHSLMHHARFACRRCMQFFWNGSPSRGGQAARTARREVSRRHQANKPQGSGPLHGGRRGRSSPG